MLSEMLGEEITEPPVSNLHVKERFEGPTSAVEEWAGSARHWDQELTILGALSVGASRIAQS